MFSVGPVGLIVEKTKTNYPINKADVPPSISRKPQPADGLLEITALRLRSFQSAGADGTLCAQGDGDFLTLQAIVIMQLKHRQIKRNPAKPPLSGANGMKSKSCLNRHLPFLNTQ